MSGNRIGRALTVGLVLGTLSFAGPLRAAETVTALGRLEPGDGVVEVTGPSTGSAVVASLAVEEGDFVEAGQRLAILDGYKVGRATVEQRRAELALIDQQLARLRSLRERSISSRAEVEDLEADRRVAGAAHDAALAELALEEIRAPIAGQVLEIHARPGERIGREGLLALGETRRMMTVAEVYETDSLGVERGQLARITSPALPEPVPGVVERVGLQIGRQGILDTDPVAKIDSRVVEVRIRLEPESPELAALVASLTNLQVDVEIER
ncbi:MAG: HlyD family efflux transporter periplasmic adaptor subunit [Myxococcota bacterium]